MYSTGKFLTILFVVVIAINDVAGVNKRNRRRWFLRKRPIAREANVIEAEAAGRSEMFSNINEAQVVDFVGRDEGDNSAVVFGAEKSGV
ncbi:uncharacterized protein LOC120842983 [Ixodes scapularis]|uniref:uncharacterized protein LOC120842983 n=1 Tax=Ixodes scapularis TaxID=6945 RepID=UPI001A9E1B87|nr:uncharacterized protein LOC120842983 [Ixodes scapularis]